jgi:outer membrane protein assembly factor BamB
MKMKTEAICSLVLVLLFLASVFPAAVSSRAASYYSSTGSPGAQPTVDWWSMLHHDSTHDGYSTSAAPGTNQILWSYTTSGAVESSPAVVNGTVFVGSDDGNVYALNLSTGAKIWNYTTGNIVGSSPAVAKNEVYVGGWNHEVYALNASTGAKLWNYSTGSYVFSSPTLAYGKVYVGSQNFGVYALNASTGKRVWNYTTGASVQSSPAVAGGVVFVGSDDDKVYALNASTGVLVWSYATGGMVESSPAVAGGVVFVGSYDDKVYALSASTGKQLWSYTTGFPVQSSPAVAGSRVFVGSDDWKLYALNASTGKPLWSFKTGSYVHSSPAVAGGVVFVGSYDDKVYALNASTGVLVWSYATGGMVESSPAVAGDLVFVGSRDGKVYSFGRPPYSLTVNAHDITQGADVSVQITMDGSPTGYTTPHTFLGLLGPHTITVPNTDSGGHPFKQWATGETSTTATVTSNGTDTAYYRALPSVDVISMVGITGYKLVFEEALNNSFGSQETVGYYWSFAVDKWNGTLWVATAITGSSAHFTGYVIQAKTEKNLPYYVYPLNSSSVKFGDWLRVRYTFNWNYSGINYSIALVTKLNVHPGDITGAASITFPYLGADGDVNLKDLTLIALNWLKTVPAGTDPTSALARADINGDGSVNLRDVTLLALSWLRNWTNTPP